MQSLRVADLAAGVYCAPLGLLPIDYVRHAKPQTHGGVGASYVDVRPRAGFAVFTPSPGNGRARVDANASLHNAGVVTSLPVPSAPAFIGRGSL